jgi:hypothetical protein
LGEKRKPCVIDYWEAWEVIGGVIRSNTPHDSFILPGTIGTCLVGTAHQTGFARFVALADINPPAQRHLPGWHNGPLSTQSGACKDFNDFFMTSGSLLRTDKRPPNRYGIWNKRWDNNPLEVTFHDLKTSWNCCPEEPCPAPGKCPENPSEVQCHIST